MSQELIIYLLSWAVFYTGYPMPDELPTIDVVKHEYFVSSVCAGIDTIQDPCGGRGMYNDKESGHIYLNEKYIREIDAEAKGTIIHEMVHYLQDMSGDWEDMEDWQAIIICVERGVREREAYQAQAKYLEDVHNIQAFNKYRRTYDRCER